MGEEEGEVGAEGEAEPAGDGGLDDGTLQVEAVGPLGPLGELIPEIQEVGEHVVHAERCVTRHEQLPRLHPELGRRLHPSDVRASPPAVLKRSGVPQGSPLGVFDGPIDGRKYAPNRVQVIETLRDGPASGRRPLVEPVVGKACDEGAGLGLDGFDLPEVVGEFGRHGKTTEATPRSPRVPGARRRAGSLPGTPLCPRQLARAVSQWTTTVPCIEGWMWQVYAYVPAVAKVRAIDTFVLLPAMSVGAPACCVKNTLCGTDPNANVTASPAFTLSVVGVNVRDGVAATVLSGGGGAAVP